MKLKLFFISLAILALASCGGNSSNNSSSNDNEHKISIAQSEIKGDLKGCYEIVDKKYKVTTDGYGYDVTIELKRTLKELPYDRKNVANFRDDDESTAVFCAGFGIEILDENGDVIAKQSAKHPNNEDEITEALQLLPDETATIQFSFYDDITSAVSFRISSLVEENKKRKTEIDNLLDAAQKATEMAEDIDIEQAQEDTQKALETTEKAMEATGKMLDILGGL